MILPGTDYQSDWIEVSIWVGFGSGTIRLGQNCPEPNPNRPNPIAAAK